jgi:hypothetical protein
MEPSARLIHARLSLFDTDLAEIHEKNGKLLICIPFYNASNFFLNCFHLFSQLIDYFPFNINLHEKG